MQNFDAHPTSWAGTVPYALAVPVAPARDPLYRGYRVPAEIISHAVWLYSRFHLRVTGTLKTCWPSAGFRSATKPSAAAVAAGRLGLQGVLRARRAQVPRISVYPRPYIEPCLDQPGSSLRATRLPSTPRREPMMCMRLPATLRVSRFTLRAPSPPLLTSGSTSTLQAVRTSSSFRMAMAPLAGCARWSDMGGDPALVRVPGRVGGCATRLRIGCGTTWSTG